MCNRYKLRLPKPFQQRALNDHTMIYDANVLWRSEHHNEKLEVENLIKREFPFQFAARLWGSLGPETGGRTSGYRLDGGRDITDWMDEHSDDRADSFYGRPNDKNYQGWGIDFNKRHVMLDWAWPCALRFKHEEDAVHFKLRFG